MKSTALNTLALMMVCTHLSYSQVKKIADFQLKNISTGQYVSLSDYKEKKVLVIIFTSNSCPYSKLYEKRILKLAQEYSDKQVQFLLVNSNNPSSSNEDNAPEIIRKLKDKNIDCAYLDDTNQQLCSQLGASKTPEVFVFENNQGTFLSRYNGAIDDNPQIESDVRQYFLRESIEAILQKNSLTYTNMRATGCIIRGNKIH